LPNNHAISILLPILNPAREYLSNFAFTLERAIRSNAFYEIIVIEQTNPRFKSKLLLPPSIRHILANLPDYDINLERLILEGAEKSTTDLLYIHDSDIYIEFKRLSKVSCPQGKFVYPLQSFMELSEEQSILFMKNGRLSLRNENTNRISPKSHSGYCYMCQRHTLLAYLQTNLSVKSKPEHVFLNLLKGVRLYRPRLDLSQFRTIQKHKRIILD